MKSLYLIQIFHRDKFIYMPTEVLAVNDNQALKLAGLQNPGWVVKRVISKRVVK